MIDNTKRFKNPEFKIKDTNFHVKKLSPMNGFHLSEYIRVNLAKSSDTFDAGEGTEDQNALLFFKSVLGLDPEIVEHIRKELFGKIDYKSKGQKDFINLKDTEDMAFEDFEVINIYEVLVRALCVNFIGSISEILSTFPSMATILKQLSLKT